MANTSTAPASTTEDHNAPLSPDTLKTDARDAIDEARKLASTVTDEAMQEAGEIAEGAKAQLTEQVDKVKGMAAEQKDLLAAQVGGVADAMDRVAGELETNNGSSARYVRLLADRAGKVSSTIRDNDVDTLVNMAQDFGRKQPAAFVGLAAAIGFAASRFLLASAKQPADEAEAVAGQSAAQYAPSTGSSGTVDNSAGSV